MDWTAQDLPAPELSAVAPVRYGGGLIADPPTAALAEVGASPESIQAGELEFRRRRYAWLYEDEDIWASS
jgi:hypothetical protein